MSLVHCHNTRVMGVLKIENIVSGARIKHTSLAFWASVLTITPLKLPDATSQPTSTYLCDSLYETSVQTIIGQVYYKANHDKYRWNDYEYMYM